MIEGQRQVWNSIIQFWLSTCSTEFSKSIIERKSEYKRLGGYSAISRYKGG